jgi:hypothetical protein
VLTGGRDGRRRPESGAAAAQADWTSVDCNKTERGREIEIRWGRPPNVHGNGKMERKR